MCERFHHFGGAARWAALSPEQQATIGAAALECVAGSNAVLAEEWEVEQTPRGRASEEAWYRATERLEDAVNASVPSEAWLDQAGRHLIPSIVGPICRECGCTEFDPCDSADGPCSWAEPDLCTACVGKAVS